MYELSLKLKNWKLQYVTLGWLNSSEFELKYVPYKIVKGLHTKL